MAEKSRNEQIAHVLEQDRVPLLPFELHAAKEALKHHLERQSRLGAAMGGAMGESSETFHDNAPAEAIANDAHINTVAAQAVIDTINNVQEFERDSEYGVVTLGSIVELRVGQSSIIETYLVTGGTRELTEEVKRELGIPEDAESVTLKSPLGKAIFDKAAGMNTSMNVHGRQLPIEIVSVK